MQQPILKQSYLKMIKDSRNAVRAVLFLTHTVNFQLLLKLSLILYAERVK